MDFRALATLLALFFITGEADCTTQPNTSQPNTGTKPSYASVSTTTTTTSINKHEASQPLPVSSLIFIAVEWTSPCGGRLVLHNISQSVSPTFICHSNELNIEKLPLKLCKNRKGCRDNVKWDVSPQEKKDGFYISEKSSCKTFWCPEEEDYVPSEVKKQLWVYKVATSLLCCVLLLLLLLRFGRPTVRALQKRMSDKRQNRWIGPTQSHSVSYHRGKTAVNTIDKEQRHSYPALERLTVADSREPSSNRNSDYNY